MEMDRGMEGGWRVCVCRGGARAGRGAWLVAVGWPEKGCGRYRTAPQQYLAMLYRIQSLEPIEPRRLQPCYWGHAEEASRVIAQHMMASIASSFSNREGLSTQMGLQGLC